MPRPTQTFSDSSRESALPFIVEWKPSRSLRLHWIALHVCTLVIVIGAYPIPSAAKVIAAFLMVAHGLLKFPSSSGRVQRSPDGRWSIPERNIVGCELDGRTRHTGWWVHLVFTAPPRRYHCLLVRDQLEPAQWSALLVGLRTGFWTQCPGRRRLLE